MTEFGEKAAPSPSEVAAQIVDSMYADTVAAHEEYVGFDELAKANTEEALGWMSIGGMAEPDEAPNESQMFSIIDELSENPRGVVFGDSFSEADETKRLALQRMDDTRKKHRDMIAESRKELAGVDGLSDSEYFGAAAASYALNPVNPEATEVAAASQERVAALVEQLQPGTMVMTHEALSWRAEPTTVFGRVKSLTRMPVNPTVPEIGMQLELAALNGEPLTLVRDMPTLLNPNAPGFLVVHP